jgi:hypothetical protein
MPAVTVNSRSRGSSVSIVPDYGMNDGRTMFDPRQMLENFSCSLCVQTGSGAQPASCLIGTWGLSPGVKRGQGVTLTTHPILAPRSWMCRSYISSPPCAFKDVLWDCFIFFFFTINSTDYHSKIYSKDWAVDVIPYSYLINWHALLHTRKLPVYSTCRLCQ